MPTQRTVPDPSISPDSHMPIDDDVPVSPKNDPIPDVPEMSDDDIPEFIEDGTPIPIHE